MRMTAITILVCIVSGYFLIHIYVNVDFSERQSCLLYLVASVFTYYLVCQ